MTVTKVRRQCADCFKNKQECSKKPHKEKMGLHRWRHCHFEMKGTEKAGENEGKLANLLTADGGISQPPLLHDSTRRNHKAIQEWMCTLPQEKERVMLTATQRSSDMLPPSQAQGAGPIPSAFSWPGQPLPMALLEHPVGRTLWDSHRGRVVGVIDAANAERWDTDKRGLFSRLKIQWNLPFYVLDLLRPYHPFLLSYFVPFWMRMVTYACPITTFWKYITCLVSQVYNWRGNLPQDELYFKSPAYVTQMTFRWDFGVSAEAIQDLGAICMEFMYFVGKKNMNFEVRATGWIMSS